MFSKRPRLPYPIGLALVLTIAATGSTGPTPATGRTLEILPPDGEEAGQFGKVLAQQRRWLAVASPRDNGEGRIAGAVHLYRKRGSNWVRKARLVASDAATRHRFGSSLALDRRRLIVGSPLAERSIGRVYVFARSGGEWTEEVRILPPEPFRGRFGEAVAAQGPRIVIGAPQYKVRRSHRGAAFVYRRRAGAWELEQILESPRPGVGFGRSVAIRPGVLAVGMAGEVAVYERVEGEWRPVQTLQGSHGGGFAVFGNPVVMPPPKVFTDHDREIVIGAHREIGTHFRQGATYVFRERDGRWEQTHRLQSPAPEHEANFGIGVAAGARGLVIGETYGLSSSGHPGEAWFLPRDDDDFGQGRRLVESPFGDRVSIGGSVTIGPAGVSIGESFGRTVRAIPWKRDGS